MTRPDQPPIPVGKYNAEWCHRNPLVSTHEVRIRRARSAAATPHLAPMERAAVYLHELVDCEGLEFVAFTNAHLPRAVQLPGDIILVPCFVTDLRSAPDLEDPVRQATLRMHLSGRFVYDGWLPISEWTNEAVRQRIAEVDQALSTLALIGTLRYEWEPKYPPQPPSERCYRLGSPHMRAMELLSDFAKSLSKDDSQALFRSLGWLSQSLSLREPAARFLFCILAIESLATYIEDHAPDDSAFAPLRSSPLTKSDRRAASDQCVLGVLKRTLDTDPTEAVRSAYFQCVVSITRRLQTHLEGVFPDDPAPIDLLFRTRVDGRSLWDLRHLIAHGRADALSHKQRDAIAARVHEAEGTARRYVRRVLERTMGHRVSAPQLKAAIMFKAAHALMTSDEIYHGPTHMALFYT